MSEPGHTDILIIGGGFGGMNAALELDARLKRRLDASVTLISRTNFYVFTPLLAEVAASLVESRHAVNPIRRMLKRIRFIQATVEGIDAKGRTVRYVDENGQEREMAYEHCVLAPGSVTHFFGIEGLAENAFTLKTVGDAIRIRNHVVQMLERADALAADERRHLLTFVVVGGGLNGTEVAGELHDFVMEAVEDYPGIDPSEIRLLLIEMLDRLAQELPPQVGAYCKGNLESRGIEVRLETRVTAYRDGLLSFAESGGVPTETVVWSAGVRPSPLIEGIDAERVKGDDRLPTNEYLQVRGYETLWAVGDSALIPNLDADDGQPYQPPTAQHAVRQGRHVARNVHAAIDGRELEPHRYRGMGMLATLGRHRGAGRVFGIRLTGFLAWFAWRTYYLLALPRWERRLRVTFDWTLDLLFPPDIVQLKVEPVRQRLRPGQAAGDDDGGRGTESSATRSEVTSVGD